MPYRFQGQREGEEVVLLSRQHPFVLLGPLIAAGAILLIPLLSYLILPFGAAFSVIFLICFCASLAYGLSRVMAWYNSLLVLTNQRVMVTQQHGLLRREMTECSLLSIQQASHRVNGLLHTLFGYGTIEIHTAGSHQPFSVPNAPAAFEVQQEILRLVEGS